MKPLLQMQSELTLLMLKAVEICERHGYVITPTLLLRHEDGASKSLLLSNDSLGKVVLCIAELDQTGSKGDGMEPIEAVVRLFVTNKAKEN